MKWCGFPLRFIIPRFFWRAHLPLFAGIASQAQSAMHTIKWRVMKLYPQPGQIAGWRGWKRLSGKEGESILPLSRAMRNSIRPVIETFFTSLHISPLYNSSSSSTFCLLCRICSTLPFFFYETAVRCDHILQGLDGICWLRIPWKLKIIKIS